MVINQIVGSGCLLFSGLLPSSLPAQAPQPAPMASLLASLRSKRAVGVPASSDPLPMALTSPSKAARRGEEAEMGRDFGLAAWDCGSSSQLKRRRHAAPEADVPPPWASAGPWAGCVSLCVSVKLIRLQLGSQWRDVSTLPPPPCRPYRRRRPTTQSCAPLAMTDNPLFEEDEDTEWEDTCWGSDKNDENVAAVPRTSSQEDFEGRWVLPAVGCGGVSSSYPARTATASTRPPAAPVSLPPSLHRVLLHVAHRRRRSAAARALPASAVQRAGGGGAGVHREAGPPHCGCWGARLPGGLCGRWVLEGAWRRGSRGR